MVGMTNPFQVDQWIEWQTESFVKRGQVIVSKGPSIVVRWLGGQEQVFPLVGPYVTPSIDARMRVIERPKEASRIERDQRQGRMSVQRAAATLGITPKRVRAMLREGQLKGVRSDGKWTEVCL